MHKVSALTGIQTLFSLNSVVFAVSQTARYGGLAMNLDDPNSAAIKLHYPCYSLWIPADIQKLKMLNVLIG